MANAYIGSHPSHKHTVVERIDGTKQLTRSDSGKLFMCYSAGSADYMVNLPSISTDIAGWHAKFLLADITGDEIQIGGFGVAVDQTGTDGENDIILYLEVGGTENSDEGADFVKFDVGGSGATIGATIEIYSDGTKWYAIGYAPNAADIDPIG